MSSKQLKSDQSEKESVAASIKNLKGGSTRKKYLNNNGGLKGGAAAVCKVDLINDCCTPFETAPDIIRNPLEESCGGFDIKDIASSPEDNRFGVSIT
jgi:hypothetical protein